MSSMNEDLVVRTLRHIAEQSFRTTATLVKFLVKIFCDVLSVGLFILVACTLVRIPSMYFAMQNCNHNHLNRFMVLGVFNLIVFLIDIPFMLMVIPQVVCFWRIVLLYQDHGPITFDTNFFGYEGWVLRKLVFKHFCLLMSDLFFLPFLVFLHLSWRGSLFQERYRLATNEIERKLLTFKEFFALITDALTFPVLVLLMLCWRRNSVRYDLISILRRNDRHLPLSRRQITELPDIQVIILFIKLPVKYSVFAQYFVAIKQFWYTVIDLFLLPFAVILLLTWRHSIAKSVLAPWYQYFIVLDMSNEGNPIYFNESRITKDIFRNFFKFIGELVYVPLFILCMCTWRVFTLTSKVSQCFHSSFDSANPDETPAQTAERRIEHIKVSIVSVSGKIIMDVLILLFFYLSVLCTPLAPHRFRSNIYHIVRHRKELMLGEKVVYDKVLYESMQLFVDIPILLMALFVSLTLWRLPFVVSKFSKNISDLSKRKQEEIYRNIITEEFSRLIADLFIAPFLVVIIVTLWRIKPLITDARKNYDEEKSFGDTSWIYPLRRIDPIRRIILFNAVSLLLIDIPCAFLFLINVVFLIRLPAIVGGFTTCSSFHSEYPIILLTETLKLAADLIFLILGCVLAVLKPIGVIYCVLEDDKHQKYRETMDYSFVISRMLSKRGKCLEELNEMQSIIVKSECGKTDTKLSKYLLASIVKDYLIDFIYLRTKILDAELDDQYIYLLSKYIFLQDKEFSHFYRSYLVERYYLKSTSSSLRSRNAELCKRESAAYLSGLYTVINSLNTFKMEEPPLWNKKIGFFSRSREENQKLLIKNLTSGYIATILLVICNCIPIYRGIPLIIAIIREPYLVRKKAMNNLKEYYYDFQCFLQVLLILVSVYRAPQLISEIGTEIFCKGSIVALRHTISRYPANILADIRGLVKSVFKWKSIAYVIATVLFLVFIPLSSITRVIKTFHFKSSQSLVISLTSYVLLVLSPIGIAYTGSNQYQLTEFFGFVICLLLVFIFIMSKSRRNEDMSTIDYSRFDWQLIQVVASEVIQTLQIIYLVLKHTKADIQPFSLVFLDSRQPDVNLSHMTHLCYVWFLVSSAPIILEGILTYVPEGTFSSNHLFWHAFISFFNANLFLVIPHLGISYLSSGSITSYDEVWCLYFILWYLITATLFYNQFFVPAPKGLCYDPIYVSATNVVKLVMVVFPVLTNVPLSVTQTLHLIVNVLLVVFTVKVSRVSNSETLKHWRLISLFSTTLVSVGSLIFVMSPTFVAESILVYFTFAILGIAGVAMIAASYFVRKHSLNEAARSEFMHAIRELERKCRDSGYLTIGWVLVRPSWIRLMDVVRAANMIEKNEEVIQELFTPDSSSHSASNTAPPGYSEDVQLDNLPTYDEIVARSSSARPLKPGFIPDIEFLISPIGEWRPYSATAFTEENVYLEEIRLNIKNDIIIDDVCSGSYVLLLLEKYIHYESLSRACVANLTSWRKCVHKADWNGLNKYLKMLMKATNGSYIVENSVSPFSLDYILEVNPDTSTYPELIPAETIQSMKLEMHKTERVKLLSLLPHPWCLVLELLFPPTHPIIKSVSQEEDGYILDLFRSTKIKVNSVNADRGIGLAVGGEMIFPKRIFIKFIHESKISFCAPFPIGKKSFFSIELKMMTYFDELKKIGISENASMSVDLDKVIASLEDLSYY